MFLSGVIATENLLENLQRANPCPVVASREWTEWAGAMRDLENTMLAFTQGNTQNTRTRKYYQMRAAYADLWAREPLSRCQVDHQKAGRKIPDLVAMREIRDYRFNLAKDWKARATKEERGEYIKGAAILATIATAGAAATAAGAAATTAGATTQAAIGAGLKAGAASALGVEGGASATWGAIGKTALKKLALEKGVGYALEYAAEEYAKRQGKKADQAAMKQLERELLAAQQEYAVLTAKGLTPQAALDQVSAPKSSGGFILPLGLIFAAVKAFTS